LRASHGIIARAAVRTNATTTNPMAKSLHQPAGPLAGASASLIQFRFVTGFRQKLDDA
jgi:hypothetical protein